MAFSTSPVHMEAWCSTHQFLGPLVILPVSSPPLCVYHFNSNALQGCDLFFLAFEWCSRIKSVCPDTPSPPTPFHGLEGIQLQSGYANLGMMVPSVPEQLVLFFQTVFELTAPHGPFESPPYFCSDMYNNLNILLTNSILGLTFIGFFFPSTSPACFLTAVCDSHPAASPTLLPCPL